jgi:hypothetical protein
VLEAGAMSDESYYDKAEAQITQLRGEVDAANNRCTVTLVEVSRLLVRLADTERAMDDQAQALVVAIEAREKAEAERDEALKSRDGMHAAMCGQVDRAERLEAALRALAEEEVSMSGSCGVPWKLQIPPDIREWARHVLTIPEADDYADTHPVRCGNARTALSPAPGEGE